MIDVSYWSKMLGGSSDDGCDIYIVERHAANPPLNRSEWSPITVTVSSYEEFIEHAIIQGYNFLRPNRIREITGLPWVAKFNPHYGGSGFRSVRMPAS